MVSKAPLPVLHFAFLLTGVATVMVGILLPTLLTRWSITDAQAGSLFGAQFCASFLGSLLYGEIFRRLGQTATITTGMAIIAVGIAGMSVSLWPLPLPFIALCGFGLGFTLPAINLAVGSARAHSSAALNLLNFSWTLGAVSAPLLFGYMLQRLHVSLSAILFGLAALFLGAAVAVHLARTPTPVSPIEVAVSETHQDSSLTWVLTGLLLFLYVGAETSVAGWAPVMGLRHSILSPGSVSSAQVFFWGALLAGRLAAASLWRNIAPRTVISASLVTALAGAVALATCTSSSILDIGMVLAGAGLAAVFPTTVAGFAPQATVAAKRAAGVVFAAAGLGGAALPALIGWMSSHGYSLRLGLWLIAVATACMFLMEQVIAAERERPALASRVQITGS
jgi:fucose permease